MLTDSQTKFSALQLSWAARSSCKQRAGRTGRVMDGQCFRFVEKHFYDVSFRIEILKANEAIASFYSYCFPQRL